MLLKGDKAVYLLDHVLHELVVLAEAPEAAAMPQLAHILGHLVTLLRPMAMG